MNKLIFLLEDSLDLTQLFTILLEEEGYLVHAFPNVSLFKKEALVTLPNLFIIDIMLPDGNGTEVCSELKRDCRTANIPVILMSAHETFAGVKQTCHAEDFVQKPFDIDDFIKKVKKYVN